MAHCSVLFILFVLNFIHSGYSEEKCYSYCVGEQYECINGKCYCTNGYIPDYHHSTCVKCPGLGEKCFGPCCGALDNETLQCWHGVCQSCYGSHGNWICSDSMEQMLLVSGSQIVMAVALVLGIVATFTLLYKLCAVSQLRPLDTSTEGRLSIGSLQIYVNERLRDAPPKYSSAAPSGSSIYPATVYLNAGFVHDNSLPPPLYTPEQKNENEPNTTSTAAVHM
ncbi:uncharacterized protein [Maniola hyperantus]|uniref:uncharacterized protein n=1 Tax=Aphantopus hyperantus TaxID=2795564 RepID=UPI001568C647|nr:uncharacterized protein LOC117987299 [Maniola hyperantus]